MEVARCEELERDIRSACDRGDHAAAAEAALRGYGPEIFGFLVNFHRSEQDAADVFSSFSERLWRGLAGFAWECSIRTWAYTIARNASRTFREEASRRDRKHVPLPEDSGAAFVAAEVRTATAAHLKTETKSRVAQLRETLSPEDQMLLALRVDKRMAWNDLARVLHDGDDSVTDESLKRDAARLRKRFQSIKEHLMGLARDQGLLDGD